LLNEGKQCAELKSQEHKVLVDSIVVNDVPVLVENIHKSLKPKLLVVALSQIFHYVGNFDGSLPLINWLVRMPEN
jgi:hypothetical protein